MAYTSVNLAVCTGTINYLKTNEGCENNKLNIVPVDYVSKIISDTVFDSNNDYYISADINYLDSKSLAQLRSLSINYFKILNYNAKLIFKNKNFYFYNKVYDYLPYLILYYICFFNQEKKKN